MPSTNARPRALLLTYGDPMGYPPTINAANILADAGWDVDLIGYRASGNLPLRHSAQVRVTYFGTLAVGVRARLQYAALLARAALMAWRRPCQAVISYDRGGVLPGYIASRGARTPWIYHNHDLASTTKPSGPLGRLQRLAENRLTAHAAAVVFPQEGRSRVFAEHARVRVTPMIVGNAPRRSWRQPRPVHPVLRELKRHCDRVLLYQGHWGLEEQLELMIRSLPYCRERVGCCVVGKGVDERLARRAGELASALGVAQRVALIPFVPYDELPGITPWCDIGVGRLSAGTRPNINETLLLGASNKIAEYLACGLPVLLDDTEEHRRFLGEREVGLVYPSGDPAGLASAVDTLLGSRAVYDRCRTNGQRLFDTELNYDAQFAKVLRLLEEGRRAPASHDTLPS